MAHPLIENSISNSVIPSVSLEEYHILLSEKESLENKVLTLEREVDRLKDKINDICKFAKEYAVSLQAKGYYKNNNQ